MNTINYATNTKREKIAYVYEQPTANPKGLAVVMHGRRSSKESASCRDISDNALERGFAVVRFDFRGNGDSYGSPNWNDFGVLDSVDDIRAIVKELRNKKLPGCQHIILVGLSFSADPALFYASEDPLIERVISISPGTGKSSSGTNDNKWRKDWWDSNIITTQISFKELRDQLAKLKTKVDLIHGDNDESVPIEQSQEIINIVGDRAKLHIIKAGRHHYMKPESAHAERQQLLSQLLDIKT